MSEIFINISNALLPVTICLFVIFIVNKYIVANCHRLRFFLAAFAMIFSLLLPWLLLAVPGVAIKSSTGAKSSAVEKTTREIVSIKPLPAINSEIPQLGFSWLWLWIFVSGCMLIHTFVTMIYIKYFWCRKQAEISSQQREYFQKLCGELNIKRRVVLRQSKTSAPGTFGIFKPVVVVPEFLLANFSQKELRFILLHELVHVRSCDQVFVFLQKIFSSIYFFHPLAWWIAREMTQSMEVCCDKQVVLHEQNSIDYTKSFVRFLELRSTFCSSPRFAVGYFAHVKQRIHFLINTPKPISRTRSLGVIFLVLFICSGSVYTWGNGKYVVSKPKHAAMHISSYDTEDPIEVGQTTTYVIELRNEGTANCTNVNLVNDIPQEMEFVKAAPDGFSLNGQQIRFNAIDYIKPGKIVRYKITLRARESGSAKNTAFVKFNEFNYTMRNEEGTSIYGE